MKYRLHWRLRSRPAVAGRDILQKLHADPAATVQGRYAQMGAKHVVQMLLLEAVVVTLAGNMKTQKVAVERKTGAGVGDRNSCVVDSEKQPAIGLLPFRIALALRELQNLQRMTIRVTEVEGLDPSGIRIPVRQPLRIRRNLLHLVLAKYGVRLIHVADDDSHVLEGEIVTARVWRNRRTSRADELQQFDSFVAERQIYSAANVQAEIMNVPRQKPSIMYSGQCCVSARLASYDQCPVLAPAAAGSDSSCAANTRTAAAGVHWISCLMGGGIQARAKGYVLCGEKSQTGRGFASYSYRKLATLFCTGTSQISVKSCYPPEFVAFRFLMI